MRNKRVAVLLTALVLGGAGAQTYTSQKYRFSITPPVGWQRGEIPGIDAEVFYPPKEVGDFTPNLNIIRPLPTQGKPPAEVCRLNVEGIKGGLKAKNVTSTYDRAPNVCRITYTGSSEGTALRFYAELRFAGKQYYTLTFTAPTASYQRLLPAVQTSLKTFRAR